MLVSLIGKIKLKYKKLIAKIKQYEKNRLFCHRKHYTSPVATWVVYPFVYLLLSIPRDFYHPMRCSLSLTVLLYETTLALIQLFQSNRQYSFLQSFVVE